MAEQGVILCCSACGHEQRIYTPDTTLDEVILFGGFLGACQCPLCGAPKRVPTVFGYDERATFEKLEVFENLLKPRPPSSRDFDVSDEEDTIPGVIHSDPDMNGKPK